MMSGEEEVASSLEEARRRGDGRQPLQLCEDGIAL
jgi:hypothetical protein